MSMKATEILENVKELLHLSKEEQVKDIAVEEVKEEVKDVALSEEKVESEKLAEEPAEEVKEEVKEEVEEQVLYVTAEELSAVKTELMSMINSLIEDKSMGESKEVPQELSKDEVKEEKVELSADAEEVVHSPENKVEKKESVLLNNNRPMTIQERVNKILFN